MLPQHSHAVSSVLVHQQGYQPRPAVHDTHQDPDAQLHTPLREIHGSPHYSSQVMHSSGSHSYDLQAQRHSASTHSHGKPLQLQAAALQHSAEAPLLSSGYSNASYDTRALPQSGATQYSGLYHASQHPHSSHAGHIPSLADVLLEPYQPQAPNQGAGTYLMGTSHMLAHPPPLSLQRRQDHIQAQLQSLSQAHEELQYEQQMLQRNQLHHDRVAQIRQHHEASTQPQQHRPYMHLSARASVYHQGQELHLHQPLQQMHMLQQPFPQAFSPQYTSAQNGQRQQQHVSAQVAALHPPQRSDFPRRLEQSGSSTSSRTATQFHLHPDCDYSPRHSVQPEEDAWGAQHGTHQATGTARLQHMPEWHPSSSMHAQPAHQYSSSDLAQSSFDYQPSLASHSSQRQYHGDDQHHATSQSMHAQPRYRGQQCDHRQMHPADAHYQEVRSKYSDSHSVPDLDERLTSPAALQYSAGHSDHQPRSAAVSLHQSGLPYEGTYQADVQQQAQQHHPSQNDSAEDALNAFDHARQQPQQQLRSIPQQHAHHQIESGYTVNQFADQDYTQHQSRQQQQRGHEEQAHRVNRARVPTAQHAHSEHAQPRHQLQQPQRHPQHPVHRQLQAVPSAATASYSPEPHSIAPDGYQSGQESEGVKDAGVSSTADPVSFSNGAQPLSQVCARLTELYKQRSGMMFALLL